MAGDLVHHVFEKGNAGVKSGLAGAIEINLDGNLSFQGISFYPSLTFGHGDSVAVRRHNAANIQFADYTFSARRSPTTAFISVIAETGSDCRLEILHIGVHETVELVLDNRADSQLQQAGQRHSQLGVGLELG